MSRLVARAEAASGLWRSEDMELVRLTVQREAGPHTMVRLGKVGIFQPTDLNPEATAYQRSHTDTIRRCDELERKLRTISEELDRTHVDGKISSAPPFDEFRAAPSGVDGLEREIENLHTRLMDGLGRYRSLTQQRNNLIQYAAVVRGASRESASAHQHEVRPEREPLLVTEAHGARSLLGDDANGDSATTGLNVMAGAIPTHQMDTLHRGAWRVTRGNIIIHVTPMEALESPTTGQMTPMSVFVAYCASQRSATMVRRLATALNGTLYDNAVGAGSDSGRMLDQLREESQRVDDAVSAELRELSDLAAVFEKYGPVWKLKVVEEKGVAAQLNKCRFGTNTMTAVGWVPTKDYARFVETVQRASNEVSATVRPITAVEKPPKRSTIPTYFRTNSFTSNFQQIVDAYGVARYKEVNPGVFTIITFPFLFGVMFGDFGHGTIMLILSLLLLAFQNKLAHVDNEIFQMIFGGRYLIVLMAIFAVYMGTLYNDCFSLSVLWPGPKWSWDDAATGEIWVPDNVSFAPHHVATAVPKAHGGHIMTHTPHPAGRAAEVAEVFGFGGSGAGVNVRGIAVGDASDLATTPTRVVRPIGDRTVTPAVPHPTPAPSPVEHAAPTPTPDEKGMKKILYNCLEFEDIPGANMTKVGQQCAALFPSGVQADSRGYARSPWYGIDGTWTGATNKLDFLNSYKMKQSVILGVIHMAFGVVFGGLNYVRNKDWNRVIFMTIPELLFLVCTFGWMDVLIIIKWLRDWPATNTAPSLLTEMTSFFLQPGSPPACYMEPGTFVSADNCTISKDVTGGNNFLLYGQFTIQTILLLIALVSIFSILVPIIVIHFCCSKHESQDPVEAPAAGGAGGAAHDAVPASAYEAGTGARSVVDGSSGQVVHSGSRTTFRKAASPTGGDELIEMGALDRSLEEEGEEDEHDSSEVVIHQFIHTIEYALGCVSNTASYLRLWALSLAHAQLAEVFWQFTLERTLGLAVSPVLVGVTTAGAFTVWVGATMGVLVGMEGLSAFLHSLRLHWVEFQNKFYTGDGVPFEPFFLPPTPDDATRFGAHHGAQMA